MIRKQVYLGERQDRKLKAIARRRGCTEAEVIREAIDHLPEPPRSLEELLQEAGIQALPDAPSLVQGEDLDQLEREIEEWTLGLPPESGLTGAILADRAEEEGGV